MKKHYDPTEAQMHYRENFKEAAQYAKVALTDPAARAFYEMIAEEKHSNAYAMAFADFLVRPQFKPLDLSEYKGQVGDPITITATDDIGLTDVEVTLSANDGTQIERGKAAEAGIRSGTWIYTASAPVALGTHIFIEVVGFDHAGTRAKITENPTVGEEE